jgi:hypothetical protein
MSAQLALPNLTAAEARKLTDDIKASVERVWALLLEAHDRKAWAALGYGSWREYAMAEFGMSQSYAYRMLDQGRVIREIEAAAGSPIGEISEYEARDLKPHLKLVADRVREEVANVPPEQVESVVREVVATERTKLAKQRDDRQALDDLAAELNLPEIDEQAEDNRIQITHEFYRALHALAGLPPAAEVASRIPPYQHYRLAELPTALAWLTDFARAWEARS